MKLSDLDTKDIKIGMKVISDSSSVIGVIEAIWPQPISKEEDNIIEILWNNGNRSYLWHFWLDKVSVLKRQE